MDRILKNVQMGKFITTALKRILKLVKLQSLVAKFCKMRKIWPCKVCDFVHFCITHGKLIPFSRCWYQFSVRNTKICKIFNLHRLTFSAFQLHRLTISAFFKILSTIQSVHWFHLMSLVSPPCDNNMQVPSTTNIANLPTFSATPKIF